MVEPISVSVAVNFLVQHAPDWFKTLRNTLLDEGKEAVTKKSKERWHEKEQVRHLELCLKNAFERGLARFSTLEERDQYRSILTFLSESGPNINLLRSEALHLFTLSDSPNFAELTEKYNLRQRVNALAQNRQHEEIDTTAYLSNFFEALIAEMYADPFFKQEMSNVIKVRAAQSIQRSLEEVITTLRQVGENMANNYTAEQFERDVQTYVAHIERTLRYLKLVGVVPRRQDNENRNPELDGFFISLRVELQQDEYQELSTDQIPDSIIELLDQTSCLVLLGGPGSGKSTAIRHLAWSHAIANMSTSSSLSNTSLLSGKPIPLRIELRRFTEDRKQEPRYNFLSYATEVLLQREGIEINPQMFKELLERRAVLLLFDGLDEVTTLYERKRLVEEIEHFALSYPGNRFLVTSRPVGYEHAPLSNRQFSHAIIQEFDDEQIRLFLLHWYTYVLRLTPIPYDDQQELETLLKTLKSNPRLHKLAENPLLLTVITALHRYERLPDKRVLIYDQCTDLLLEIWAKLKGTNDRWKDMKMAKEDQYACLAYLGFVLHRDSKRQFGENTASDVSARVLLKEIKRFLNGRKLVTNVAEQLVEAKRFVDLMQVEAGLIVETGTNRNGEPLYGFVHRTFQEYFAAADIYECYQQEEDSRIISNFLYEHIHDFHWREVILLLLGKLKRKPATAQLRRIVDDRSFFDGNAHVVQKKILDLKERTKDLLFVCDCLAEGINVENDLAENIISLVNCLVETSDYFMALESLGRLIQTRQYSELVREKLRALLKEECTLDLLTKIEVARCLVMNSQIGGEDYLQASQMLLQIVQFPHNPGFILAAQILYLESSYGSVEWRLANQLLMSLQSGTSNIPTEHISLALQNLIKWSANLNALEKRQNYLKFLVAIATRGASTLEDNGPGNLTG